MKSPKEIAKEWCSHKGIPAATEAIRVGVLEAVEDCKQIFDDLKTMTQEGFKLKYRVDPFAEENWFVQAIRDHFEKAGYLL